MNTIHISFKPGSVDRGKLYELLRKHAGFEVIGLYNNYVFAVFASHAEALDCLQWCRTLPQGITSELAKQSYSVPYPQPVDDVDPSGYVDTIHLTHLPPNYTQEEMTHVCSWMEGFTSVHFHGKYLYVKFQTPAQAAVGRDLIRNETNIVATFSHAKRGAPPQNIPIVLPDDVTILSSRPTTRRDATKTDQPKENDNTTVGPPPGLSRLSITDPDPAGISAYIDTSRVPAMKWEWSMMPSPGQVSSARLEDQPATDNMSLPFGTISLFDLWKAHQQGEEAVYRLLAPLGKPNSREVALRLGLYKQPHESCRQSLFSHPIGHSDGKSTSSADDVGMFGFVSAQTIERHVNAVTRNI